MNKPPVAEWLDVMRRVRDARTCLIFSRRQQFDDELRPFIDSTRRIAYPDAMFYVTQADYDRAWAAVQPRPSKEQIADDAIAILRAAFPATDWP